MNNPGRRLYFYLIVFALIVADAGRALAADLRVRERLDDNWKFFLGDAPDFSRSDFVDSAWRDVTLPHDWSIEHTIDPAATTGGPGGYYVTGIGWYRRSVAAPEDWKGKQVELEFDGVYMDADVYLNGQKLELLSKVVDDAESQAAIFMPSLKMAPAMTSGSNTLPLSFRHRF